MKHDVGSGSTCSIARSLDVLGERWTLLIVREALIAGTTRFQDFRDSLGVAPNILTERLNRLVEEGVMSRVAYRDDGARERYEYVVTEAGRGLNVVIAGLAEWGRQYRPREGGTSPRYRLAGDHGHDRGDSEADDGDGGSGREAVLAFVTPNGERIPAAELLARREPDTAA